MFFPSFRAHMARNITLPCAYPNDNTIKKFQMTMDNKCRSTIAIVEMNKPTNGLVVNDNEA